MILFLVRHYNDIDHMVPIIHRMLRDESVELMVLCMDPFLDLAGDFRLRFLWDRFGCRTRYVYRAYTPSLRHRLFSLLVCQLPKWKLTTGTGLVSRLANSIGYRVYHAWYKVLYDTRWAERFLEERKVRCLVMDYGRITRFIYRPLSEAADKLGIRKVAVPHGLDLIKEVQITDRQVHLYDPSRESEDWSWLGEFTVPAEAVKQKMVSSGLPTGRISVLGSARYCDEWLKIYHDILPPVSLPPAPGKLRVVYMDHGPQYRTDPGQIVESLMEASNLGFVDLVVKLSPRGHISDERLRDFCRLDSTTHSIHLIRWAHVIITFMSSIVLEAYFHGKVFLYPAYFHRNTMRWEDYGACWKVTNLNEFLQALRSLHDGTNGLPYSEQNVQHLLTEFVYGGRPGADVLGDYMHFISADESETEKAGALRS